MKTNAKKLPPRIKFVDMFAWPRLFLQEYPKFLVVSHVLESWSMKVHCIDKLIY